MLDKLLRDLVHGEVSIGKTKIAFLDMLLAVCITAAAVMIRRAVFGISESSAAVSDTTRLVYCAMDFVLAVFMVYFVWKTTGSRLKTVGTYALTVIWPAIAANSALNGGGEVVSAVVVLAVLCVFAGKPDENTGRGQEDTSVMDKIGFWAVTLLVCVQQIRCAGFSEERLTECWPNIYTLFSETGFVAEYGVTGKLLVLGILLIIFYYISKKEMRVTPELLVASGLFFSLLISVFYPFMNYRCGLMANVFAILTFIQNKKKCYVPMAMCIISYVSYGYYYNGTTGMFFWIYALALVVLMLDAGVSLYRQLHTGKMA